MPRRSRRDVLMIVDAQTRRSPAGRAVREFDVLRELLDADVVDREEVDGHLVTRLVRRVAGVPGALLLLAAFRGPRYRTVYCDAESYGLLLAALVRLLRRPTRVTVFVHNPDHPVKRLLLRSGVARRGTSALVVNGAHLRRQLHHDFGVPLEMIHLVPMPVDPDFWSTDGTSAGAAPYVCSAGLESRDYPTLVAAADQLPVEVRIAAGSPYSTRPTGLEGLPLPPNVSLVDCDTAGLRDLYAGSRFVVVPLLDVDTVAGVTTIAEAMSLGKCVITTRSAGQSDTVADRRAGLRDGTSLPTQGTLAALVDAADEDLRGPTGLYVRPGDPDELRRAINYLLEHPELCDELGRRGRRVAEQVLDVRRVSGLIAAVVRHPSRVRFPSPAQPKCL